MEFNFDNDRPIYVQLVEQLKLLIVSGKFELGERIPSVRELATKTRVNPNTMQKALTELENEKLIYTERTNGKFVTTDKELVESIREKIAKENVQNYINNMQKIGISKENAILYLQK